MSWFNNLFIKEAKPALNRHNPTDVEGQTYVLVDEEGNEIPAVYVGSEMMFDATANDIRDGKTAVTEEGITVGTKEIPAYITTEGYKAISAGKPMTIKIYDGKHAYTKLQAIVCKYNTTAANSVAAEKVCINDKVYTAGAAEVLSTVSIDNDTESINFELTNDSTKPVIIRYFTYKEEY